MNAEKTSSKQPKSPKITSFEGKLKNAWNAAAKTLADIIFPEKLKCMFCGAEILDFENAPYCEQCEAKLPFNNGQRCMICDVPVMGDEKVCEFCKRKHPSFKKAVCPFLYEGIVQSAILSFKSENQRHFSTGFAQLIAKRILDEKLEIDALTFVPLTKEKEKQRTFNQTKLLATKIGEILSIPVVETLVKVREGSEQKLLTFKQRQKNAKNSFALVPNLPNFKNILIVDDVITTGATIEACAALLKKKAENVFVCAIARQYVRPEQETIFNNMKFQTFSILT